MGLRHTDATILISGAGQLGSRYLQGLANCRTPLSIYVHDIQAESIARAMQRWNEAAGPQTRHDVSFHASVKSLPRQLDIAIVATTADVRPRVVGDIASVAAVRSWALGKVLAQSESGLDEITSCIADRAGAWINTPRRMMPWHQQIKAQLDLTHPLTLGVEGGLWGLASNAIHLLDLVAWWTGETLQEVRTDRLDPHWFEAKRQGNWEVLGTLEARFSGGSLAVLSAREDGGSSSLEVSGGHRSWLIREAEGLARRSDGIEIPGRMAYQSEMSASLVDSILEGGCCDLPTLDESVILHRVFMRGMLEHWKRAGNYTATAVPIT